MTYTIKQWRWIKSLTQDQLAEKVGVTRSTIYAWERNPEIITVRQAKILTGIFGCSLTDINFDAISDNKMLNEGGTE